MQRMNDCYVIDEADVPVVIKHLNTAGYHAIPHWYLTHYAKAVTICSTRVDSILTPTSGFGGTTHPCSTRILPPL